MSFSSTAGSRRLLRACLEVELHVGSCTPGVIHSGNACNTCSRDSGKLGKGLPACTFMLVKQGRIVYNHANRWTSAHLPTFAADYG